ncbi:MAG: hypothetical protein ABL889_17925 [Terricaulis sp.]
MRIVLAAALMLAQVSVAAAQTTPPVEETPATAPAPEAPAPTTCAEFPPEPAAIDYTRANPTQMSAASARQSEWRARMNEVIECRRLYYNAAIAHFNEVNGAWSTQLDAFCARGNIRCTPQDRAQE